MVANKVSSLFLIILLPVATQTALVSGFTGSSVTTCRSNKVVLSAEQFVTAPYANTKSTSDTIDDEKRNNIATKLLTTCAEYGQVGSKLTEEERSIIDDIAASLSPSTSPSPAKIALSGKHELIYSASPSASSGALGPLTGKVTQSFLDET